MMSSSQAAFESITSTCSTTRSGRVYSPEYANHDSPVCSTSDSATISAAPATMNQVGSLAKESSNKVLLPSKRLARNPGAINSKSKQICSDALSHICGGTAQNIRPRRICQVIFVWIILILAVILYPWPLETWQEWGNLSRLAKGDEVNLSKLTVLLSSILGYLAICEKLAIFFSVCSEVLFAFMNIRHSHRWLKAVKVVLRQKKRLLLEPVLFLMSAFFIGLRIADMPNNTMKVVPSMPMALLALRCLQISADTLERCLAKTKVSTHIFPVALVFITGYVLIGQDWQHFESESWRAAKIYANTPELAVVSKFSGAISNVMPKIHMLEGLPTAITDLATVDGQPYIMTYSMVDWQPWIDPSKFPKNRDKYSKSSADLLSTTNGGTFSEAIDTTKLRVVPLSHDTPLVPYTGSQASFEASASSTMVDPPEISSLLKQPSTSNVRPTVYVDQPISDPHEDQEHTSTEATASQRPKVSMKNADMLWLGAGKEKSRYASVYANQPQKAHIIAQWVSRKLESFKERFERRLASSAGTACPVQPARYESKASNTQTASK